MFREDKNARYGVFIDTIYCIYVKNGEGCGKKSENLCEKSVDMVKNVRYNGES